jgi:hypothetical protein
MPTEAGLRACVSQPRLVLGPEAFATKARSTALPQFTTPGLLRHGLEWIARLGLCRVVRSAAIEERLHLVMMLVETELKPSTIHGFGVFLTQPIHKGELIWRFDSRIDLVYTEEEIATLPLHVNAIFAPTRLGPT